MTEPHTEKPLYQEGRITITSLRAIFGEKTYPVANITSVEMQTHQPVGCFLAVMALVGVLVAVNSILSMTSASAFAFGAQDRSAEIAVTVIGLILVTLGVVGLRAQKPSYVVKLTTSSGEIKAHTSPDQQEIKRIVAALNDAIIQKR